MLKELLEQLSAPEKRYLSLRFQQSKDKDYVRLYSIMMSGRVMNTAQIQNKLNISESKLARIKHYLSEQILKEMRSYSLQQNFEETQMGLLWDVQFLMDKGLEQAAAKRLKKLKSIVLEHDLKRLAIEIYDMERKFCKRFSKGNITEQIETISLEQNQVLRSLMEENILRALYDRLFQLERRREINVKESEFAFREEEEKLMKAANADDWSFTNYMLYLKIEAVYARIKKNFKRAFEFWTKILEHWDIHPSLISKENRQYRIDIHNYFQICYRTRNLDQMPAYIDRLKSLKSPNENEKALSLYLAYSNELMYYLNKFDLNSAEQLVPSIKEMLESKHHLLPRRNIYSLYYNIGIMYFLKENYEESESWFDKEYDISKQLEDRFTIGRITLKLIIAAQIHPYEWIQTQINLAYRYLRAAGLSDKRVKSFLKRIVKLCRSINSRQAQTADFESLKKYILKEIKVMKLYPTGTDEILLWLDSRIERKPIAEILKTHPDY